jgi:hypothetical protein
VLIAGKPIGRLQSLRPSADRQVEPYRGVWPNLQDLEAGTVLVPGHVNYTLVAERFETYNESIFEVLGYPNGLQSMQQITQPIEIQETLRSPSHSLLIAAVTQSPIQMGAQLLSDLFSQRGHRKSLTIVYRNCIPQAWSKTINVGSISVTESVTLRCTSIGFNPIPRTK